MHYCKNCARFIPLRATENTLKKNAFYQCDPGTMAHDNFAKIAEYSAFADDERLVPKRGGRVLCRSAPAGRRRLTSPSINLVPSSCGRPSLALASLAMWETLPCNPRGMRPSSSIRQTQSSVRGGLPQRGRHNYQSA